MQDAWEYLILNGRWERVMQQMELRDEADVEYGPFNEATLNALGVEGWEVCGYQGSGQACTLILKRRIDAGS